MRWTLEMDGHGLFWNVMLSQAGGFQGWRLASCHWSSGQYEIKISIITCSFGSRPKMLFLSSFRNIHKKTQHVVKLQVSSEGVMESKRFYSDEGDRSQGSPGERHGTDAVSWRLGCWCQRYLIQEPGKLAALSCCFCRALHWMQRLGSDIISILIKYLQTHIVFLLQTLIAKLIIGS